VNHVINLVLVSHGPLAQGFAAAAEMIVGPLEAVYCIGLNPEDGPESLCARVEQALQASAGGQVLLLTDLLGGTPFNTCVRFFQERQIPVLTGLNLPMLLTAVTERDQELEALVDRLTEAGREGVRSLAEVLETHAERTGGEEDAHSACED
jgi:mannose/fructose-specific phosphotransferase system component IIA